MIPRVGGGQHGDSSLEVALSYATGCYCRENKWHVAKYLIKFLHCRVAGDSWTELEFVLRVIVFILIERFAPRLACRHSAVAGRFVELPRSADARVDEVLGDAGDSQHRQRGELGVHAGAVQVG